MLSSHSVLGVLFFLLKGFILSSCTDVVDPRTLVVEVWALKNLRDKNGYFLRRNKSLLKDFPTGTEACDYCVTMGTCDVECRVGRCEFTTALSPDTTLLCKDFTWNCPSKEEPRHDFLSCADFPAMKQQCDDCKAGECGSKCWTGLMAVAGSADPVMSFNCEDSPSMPGLTDCARLG